MKCEVNLGRGQKIAYNLTVVDRVVSYFNPIAGRERVTARIAMALTGGYKGARKDRRATNIWSTGSGDADTDILFDLPLLRERSRDLIRNTPIATGACNTTCTNVVGTGLKLHPEIDHEFLGLSEEQATAWEATAGRLWRLWAESKECDAGRTINFYGIQNQAFRGVFENGDVFPLLPRFKRSGSPFRLKVQLIEADRVCNRDAMADEDLHAGGIKKDKNGAPVSIDILEQHPGNLLSAKSLTWLDPIPIYGAKSGQPNILHLFDQLRPGQSRGVPSLAPVIEPLKHLDRFTEAELMKAVVQSLFTVFITSPDGDVNIDETDTAPETTAKSSDKDLKLASGNILGLGEHEDVKFAQSTSPNDSFEPFFIAIVKQIGMALEIPFEILIKHFSSSFSASQAALLEAWRFFNKRRNWLAENLCQPVYETFLYEMVVSGQLTAPGFLTDPLIKKAYCGGKWIGPPRGMIKETEEVKAAKLRVDGGFSALDDEILQMTGSDFQTTHRKRKVEKEKRVKDGLELPPQPKKESNSGGGK